MTPTWQILRPLLAVILIGVIMSGCCVAEGTIVATPSGGRPIESLVVGDQVLSVSSDGEVQTGWVVKTVKHPSFSVLRLTMDDGSYLRVTDWHPVAVRTGWVNAGNLRVGQSIRGQDDWKTITAIDHELGLIAVYDLSVMPNANFIANGLVVHNKSYALPPPPSELPGAWTGPTLGKYPSFCRMELNADGTGSFANGPTNLYQISKWSTGKSVGPASYEFRAHLEPVDGCCGPSDIVGEVSAGGISYRVSMWYWGLKGFLMREEALTKELEQLKSAMAAPTRSEK